MTPQEQWEQTVRHNDIAGDYGNRGLIWAKDHVAALTAERDRLRTALQEIVELAGVVSHDMRDLDMAAVAMRALEAKA